MSENHLDCYLNNVVCIYLPLQKGSGVCALHVIVKSLKRKENKVIEIFFNLHPALPNDQKNSCAFWDEDEEAWFYQYHSLKSATVRCLDIECIDKSPVIEQLMLQSYQRDLKL